MHTQRGSRHDSPLRHQPISQARGHVVSVAEHAEVDLRELADRMFSRVAGAPPRPSGREASTAARQMPIHIRAAQSDLRQLERDYIRRKLCIKLEKYVRSVERISVRLEDVNGPRGGVDQSCRIKVVLRSLPSVVFESRDAALNAAVDAALAGVERAVRRTVQRRRMKPLKRPS